MHVTGSFLWTIIERVKTYLDDSDVDAKYSEDFLVRHIINTSMEDVVARLELNTSTSIVLFYDFTIDENVTRYHFPPNVNKVLRLVSMTDSTSSSNARTIIFDAIPRSRFHDEGPGWAIEGVPGSMELYIPDPPSGSTNMRVWYVPSYDVMPFYSSTGGDLSTSGGVSTMVFPGTANLGAIDRRPNAYAGCTLRLLPNTTTATAKPIEERILSSYSYALLSQSTSISGLDKWSAATRVAFTHNTSGTNVKFEVAPPLVQPLYEAISVRAAMKLGTHKRMTQVHKDNLLREYRMAMKTVGDRMTNMQGRTGQMIDRHTVDNQARGGWTFFSRT